MKLKQWQKITGGSAIGIFILYFVFRDKIDAYFLDMSGATEEGSDKIDESKILKMGSRGASVAELQRRLNSMGSTLETDGVFGKKTLAALIEHKGVEKIKLSQWAFIEYKGEPINYVDTGGN